MSGTMLDFGALADELHALLAVHGRAALRDKRRTVALLLDHRPEQRREIRALAAGLDERLVAELLGADRGLAGIIVDRQMVQLEQDTVLRGDIARGIVGTLAFALDLGPRPNATADVPPVPPPAPSPHAPTPVVPVGPPARPPRVPLQPATGAPVGLRIAVVAGAAAVALAIVAVPPLLRGGQPAAVANAGYADEAADFGVAAQAELRDEVASPTPLSIPAGRRIVTAELRRMLAAAEPPLLLDVLAGPHDRTIGGARYLATAGAAGTFDDAEQERLVRTLRRLTRGDRDRALVIYCGGSQCWESYNAVLRAAHAGYRSLYWYRGGLSAWAAAGLSMAPTPAPERTL